MDNKTIMYRFIKEIQRKKLLTSFLTHIFDYRDLKEYNYIFRISKNEKEVLIDIYDNISKHRFNRYIFIFTDESYPYKTKEINNVYVTKICLKKINDDSNKLHKLAYTFSLHKKDIIEYANTYLDPKYISILKDIIK